MKTMTKKIIGIVQAGLLCFLTCGICMADVLNGNGEAIPIYPIGVIDGTITTYEWTSVPGATMYCLLIEDIDGVPLYLAWYTEEEAGCAQGEELCSITPDARVDGDVWAVLPCTLDECGRWSQMANFRGRTPASPDATIGRDRVCIYDDQCIKSICTPALIKCMRECIADPPPYPARTARPKEVTNTNSIMLCADKCTPAFNACKDAKCRTCR